MNLDPAQIANLITLLNVGADKILLLLLIFLFARGQRATTFPLPPPVPVEPPKPVPPVQPIPVPPAPSEPAPPVGEPGKPPTLPAPPVKPVPAPAPDVPAPAPVPVPLGHFKTLRGRCSEFGGPEDTGVGPDEGLALVERSEFGHRDWAGIFLDTQPPGTTGLARALDPTAFYIACWWDYAETSRRYLQGIRVTVTNVKTGKSCATVRPVDKGPNPNTNRVADLSPGLLEFLGLETDDIVEVEIPLPSTGPAQPTPAPTPSPVVPGEPLVLGGIIDTNQDVTPRLAALKAGGIGTVFRYVAPNQATQHNKRLITADEAHAIADAGMNLGLVYETNGKPSGAATGSSDGQAALRVAVECGASAGACIYYAVDYDPSSSDMPGIIAAFTAFRAVVAPMFRVGAYASGTCNAALFSKGLIEKRWLTQSMGFSGTRAAVAAGEYDLLQALPKTIAGLDTDPDTPHVANGDIGVFRPFAAGTPAQAPDRSSPAAPATPSPQGVPPWLATMRDLVARGIHATHDNASILAWPGLIASKYPEMLEYCNQYKHDSTPWCGLTVAAVMAINGIRPVFGPTDTDRFLWADAWRQFGTAVDTPQPGDVLVFKWAGGGEHVTLYDHEEDDEFYHCSGGNQGSGHVVSTEAMPMANCIAIRRPPAS